MENTTVKELDIQYQTFSENVSKFSEAGNKAAGTRARKALSEITTVGLVVSWEKENRKLKTETKNVNTSFLFSVKFKAIFPIIF